jgi:hypothetical protein
MGESGEELTANFNEDPFVQQYTATLERFAKRLSAEFDQYGDDNIQGSNLYLILFKDHNIDDIVKDVLKDNIWDDNDDPRYVHDLYTESVDEETFYDEFRELADGEEYDGAAVIFMNGRIYEKMLRIADQPDTITESTNFPYDGTGTLSAAYTSLRDDVYKTIKLSGEDGTVRVFQDGDVEEHDRDDDILPDLIEDDDKIVDKLLDDGIIDEDDIDEYSADD